MKGVSRAMMNMNRQMNMPQIQQILHEFEKQSEIMDMKVRFPVFRWNVESINFWFAGRNDKRCYRRCYGGRRRRRRKRCCCSSSSRRIRFAVDRPAFRITSGLLQNHDGLLLIIISNPILGLWLFVGVGSKATASCWSRWRRWRSKWWIRDDSGLWRRRRITKAPW